VQTNFEAERRRKHPSFSLEMPVRLAPPAA
jgi:hypothetical protein